MGNRERLNRRNYIIAATSTTMLVAICFALALCLQNHVSEHRRLAPQKGERVSIIPGDKYDDVPIYGHDGKPYVSTWRNTVPAHQKSIASAKGKALHERVSGLVTDIRTIDGVVYYGLDAFPSRTKWFTEEYLGEYEAPPGPTQEEIAKKERKKQAYEAMLKSVPQPNWLKEGCTYHVGWTEHKVPPKPSPSSGAILDGSPPPGPRQQLISWISRSHGFPEGTVFYKHEDGRTQLVKPICTTVRGDPVKDGNYEATYVFQGHNSKDGKWKVALDYTYCIDPKNINPQECVAKSVGAKCTNCS